MRSILAVIRRELGASFNSPTAYAVVVFFLVFTSAWLFFVQQFFAKDSSSLRDYFGIFPTVFILVVPAITMRSWAEERRLGTDELLLTYPVREEAVVVGKYVAALVLLALALVLTLPLPLTVARLGFFDPGQIASEYLGALLLAAAAVAVGQFLSAVAGNQTTAFLATVLALLFLTFVGDLPKLAALPYRVASAVSYLSIDYHFESFRKGILDTRDVAYFLILTVGFLYANAKVIVLERWR